MTDPLSARTVGLIREIPDYPQPGIGFKDITPLLADGRAIAEVVAAVAEPYRGQVDLVVGIEARGFILGSPVALALGAGFVPIRKKGKLPAATVAQTYELEYGSAEIEMHSDGIAPGQRVLVVDDVLATGGTAAAACTLIERVGGVVEAVSVLMELSFLPGRQALDGRVVRALITV